MFGKLMNRFYYGKSGQGDFTEENLPTTRWQLFWEMLRIRFSALVRLNLIYVIIWIPAILVVMITFFNALQLLSITEEAQLAAVPDQLRSLLMTMLMLLIPCIAITGPFTAGVSYVTRNWSRDEHAFIWSDFKDAVKANWKQSLVISLITGLLPFLIYICWTFYGNAAQGNAILIVPQMLLIPIGLIWAISVSFMHPMIIGYKLTIGGAIRNSFLIAMAKLPLSLALRLLHCVPALIAAVIILLWNPIYGALFLFGWYVLIGFSLSRFVTASFANAFFDQYLNSKIEGAEVNRGLRKETDDDAEDDGDDAEIDRPQD